MGNSAILSRLVFNLSELQKLLVFYEHISLG